MAFKAVRVAELDKEVVISVLTALDVKQTEHRIQTLVLFLRKKGPAKSIATA